MENITLYFRQGASDKVYQASIESADGGHVVRFAYGRRGATLQTGTKTNSPVPYEEAKRIYDKLVAEKTAKGYTPGEDGTPYRHTEKETLKTGIQCQLLNPITAAEVEYYLNDPEFVMQEKHDGRRLLIQKRGDSITGINRQGLAISLPETLIADVRNCPIDATLDGEAVGDTFIVFDLLAHGDTDWRDRPYLERLLRLINLAASFPHPHIQLVETTYQAAEKRELFERVKQKQREGVVFKHVDALYSAGRPSSGGRQLKYKFYESASLIVGRVNAKRSVSLLLGSDTGTVSAGKVTIPPNHGIPAPGQIVECRYLYAFRESGHLYQPTYLGLRQDLTAGDCTVDQFKYKPATP